MIRQYLCRKIMYSMKSVSGTDIFIEDYLSVLGCELTHDAQEHIFCLTGDGAAREKLNMTETVILLIIKPDL